MKADFDTELQKIQSFLGTDVKGEKLEELKRRVNIKTMQSEAAKMSGKMRESNMKFYQRNGQVGGIAAAIKDDKEVDLWRKWVRSKVKDTGIPMEILD